MIAAGLLAILLLPPLTIAAETCPWLNAATAEGVLGVLVEVRVTHSAAYMACSFSNDSKPAKVSLRIEVVTGVRPAAPDCSSPAVSLKTIGNEAVACAVKTAAGQITEAVVGRVRDQHFRIEVTTDDQHVSRDKLREEARTVALHVAGNLF